MISISVRDIRSSCLNPVCKPVFVSSAVLWAGLMSCWDLLMMLLGGQHYEDAQSWACPKSLFICMLRWLGSAKHSKITQQQQQMHFTLKSSELLFCCCNISMLVIFFADKRLHPVANFVFIQIFFSKEDRSLTNFRSTSDQTKMKNRFANKMKLRRVK